jgi:hypothetical protein
MNIGKINDPLGRGQFLPQGFYFNKFGRHLLEDVSCQISKLYLFWFLERKY